MPWRALPCRIWPSLSTLHGFQLEFDVGENKTLYGAIRFGEHRRPLREIIRKSQLGNRDLVPANLELKEFEQEAPKALLGVNQPRMFATCVDGAQACVDDDYDVVVVDCPPQLDYLTLSAVRGHRGRGDCPSADARRDVDLFLLRTSDLPRIVGYAGGNMGYDWLRYLVTRYEPGVGPQNQMVSFMRSMFGEHVLNYPMLKSAKSLAMVTP